MYEKVRQFQELLQILGSRANKIEYKESASEVTARFTAELVTFRNILSDFTNDSFELENIAYYINYSDDFTILPDDLHDIDDFDKSRVVPLVVKIEKAQRGQPWDYLCFLDLVSFSDFLETAKQEEFTRYFPYMSRVYLPIDTEAMNGLVQLLPLKELRDLEKKSLVDEEKRDSLEWSTETYFTRVASRQEVINPYLLYFKNLENMQLQDILNYRIYISITHYICNHYYHEQFVFNGKKEIRVKQGGVFLTSNTGTYFKIFNFIYDEKRFIDKSAIARNVITAYLSEESDLAEIDENISSIYNSITSKFDAYIDGKLDKFISNQKDVEKEAFKTAIDLKNEADKIVQSINATLLGLATTGLVSIIAYTKGDRWIFQIALAFFAIYVLVSMVVNRLNYRNRGKEAIEHLQVYLDQVPALEEDKKLEMEKRHLHKPIKKLQGILRLYTGISLIMVLLLVGSLYWVGEGKILLKPVKKQEEVKVDTEESPKETKDK